MDDLFATLPFWVICHPGVTLKGILKTIGPNGERAVNIFANEDVAKNVLESGSCPQDYVLRCIENPLAMYGLFVLLEKWGFTHVCIIFTTRMPGTVAPLSEAIASTARFFD